jgi:hypothetical protein
MAVSAEIKHRERHSRWRITDISIIVLLGAHIDIVPAGCGALDRFVESPGGG